MFKFPNMLNIQFLNAIWKLESQTIQKPTKWWPFWVVRTIATAWPFENWTPKDLVFKCSVFRSPLHLNQFLSFFQIIFIQLPPKFIDFFLKNYYQWQQGVDVLFFVSKIFFIGCVNIQILLFLINYRKQHLFVTISGKCVSCYTLMGCVEN